MAETSRLRDRLSWVRSIFFYNPAFYLYTAVMGTISLAASLFERSGRVQHWCARTWSRLTLRTMSTPVRLEGLEKVDTALPHMYALNHLSALDIPVVFGYFPFRFRIVAKKELFRYPFVGWHLHRSGQVPIERENARSAMRSLNRAADILREGMPLVVFPEGGRSPTGQVMPFLPGVFYVAIKAQVEVVPVALIGTYELLPMNTFHIRPRPIEVRFGEPIPTAGMTVRQMDELAARVQQAVEELYYSRAAVPRPEPAAGSPPPAAPVPKGTAD
jgi:1-acyl-sn-glycerol-3-phosphate acyltransferase